jgi:hypothetical protein
LECSPAISEPVFIDERAALAQLVAVLEQAERESDARRLIALAAVRLR